ncbi:MAG TPA: methyltransferase domain-containing protein, partial [Candidatus Tenderia sp.]|nr:methyltransferase domain-containing protein [Candidatus Tenderia sp.]
LDLFAGSGALGLEALSRGAGEVIFVEKNATAARAIESHLQRLDCARGRVIRAEAEAFLRQPSEPFDLVFLDPPYRSDLLARCCRQLEEGGWLAPEARIYIEASSQAQTLPLPPQWQISRSKKAGDVGYHLIRRQH